MRKTSDLVSEMLTEAKTAYLAAIAVAFEQETEFVFSTQRQPLATLNRLVQRGGAPIGILRFEKEGNAVQGSYRPFTEYGGQEWAETYLAGLLDHTAEIVAQGLQQEMSNAY